MCVLCKGVHWTAFIADRCYYYFYNKPLQVEFHVKTKNRKRPFVVYEKHVLHRCEFCQSLLCIKVTGKRKRESKRPRIAIILLLLLAFVGGDECNGVIHKMALYFRHPLIFYNKTTVTSVLSFEMDATALLLNLPVAWALLTVSTAYIFFSVGFVLNQLAVSSCCKCNSWTYIYCLKFLKSRIYRNMIKS